MCLGVLGSSVHDIKRLFEKDANISIVEMNYFSSWIRDSGPTFLIERNEFKDSSVLRHDALAAVSWKFNGWGGIYDEYIFELDDTVADQVIDRCGTASVTKFQESFVLEGGSIHVDGEGTVLTTEECLLHPNRNPHLTKQDIETNLLRALGAEKVIWLPRGLAADEDTNGHIDNMCCFSRPGEVILSWCDNPSDEQWERSREAYELLSNVVDARGRALKIVKLPIPDPMHYSAEDLVGESLTGSGRTVGQRLAASYVNFYMANDGIVCPGFDQPVADARALRILQEVFPQRRVVQVPSRDILLGGGNIHCITQQQPLP